jgi:archaeal type IV pilus assembly protein PilA
MDLKKFFMNNKAVSPVIGVILMVAITVILAAAIGSSVFGQGTAQSAPQANLDVQSAGVNSAGTASIRIEHLGGDPINFDPTITKVAVSVNGGNSQTLTFNPGTLNVGDVKKLDLMDTASTPVAIKDNSVTPAVIMKAGNTVNFKVIDVKTNQLICDKDIRF